MTTLMIFDPLFRMPIITGLCAALVLPMLGVLLHARREWLAALGLSHVSAATQLLGIALNWGLTLTTGAAAIMALAVQACMGKKGNASYALMILLGWSTVYLFAANYNMGEQMAHAMSDGQLLLVNTAQMSAMLIVSLFFLLFFPKLLKLLIKHEFFPLHAALNAERSKPWLAVFYLLTALILTVSTGSLGLMATFALLFMMPLISFKLCRSLRHSIWFSAIGGVVIYLLAVAMSLQFDQPFGGVMVMALFVVHMLVRMGATVFGWSKRISA